MKISATRHSVEDDVSICKSEAWAMGNQSNCCMEIVDGDIMGIKPTMSMDWIKGNLEALTSWFFWGIKFIAFRIHVISNIPIYSNLQYMTVICLQATTNKNQTTPIDSPSGGFSPVPRKIEHDLKQGRDKLSPWYFRQNPGTPKISKIYSWYSWIFPSHMVISWYFNIFHRFDPSRYPHFPLALSSSSSIIRSKRCLLRPGSGGVWAFSIS